AEGGQVGRGAAQDAGLLGRAVPGLRGPAPGDERYPVDDPLSRLDGRGRVRRAGWDDRWHGGPGCGRRGAARGVGTVVVTSSATEPRCGCRRSWRTGRGWAAPTGSTRPAAGGTGRSRTRSGAPCRG